MKLYVAPGACSLSPNVTLRELGIPFELVKVDLREKRTSDGSDFRAINPKGYVPALLLDSGELLTEGAVMVQYLADQHPERGLAPPNGTMARVRLQEQLHFIATELHKGMSPLYNPKLPADFGKSLRERLHGRFATLAETLDDRPYVMGEFSIVDPYALYAIRAWSRFAEITDPRLLAFAERMHARPTVIAACEAEGLPAALAKSA